MMCGAAKSALGEDSIGSDGLVPTSAPGESTLEMVPRARAKLLPEGKHRILAEYLLDDINRLVAEEGAA